MEPHSIFGGGPGPRSEHSGPSAFSFGPFSFGPFGYEHHGGHGHHRHGSRRGEGSRRGRRGGPYGRNDWTGDFGADFWRAFGRGWGRGGPPFGPGRPPRARRGDIRLGILHLLADADRPMHGYEMIRELQDRSGGAWRPSAGSIYPTLQLLEDEGLVESTEGTGKRLYALTQAGRDEIDNRGGQAPWEEFSEPTDSPWTDLRNAGVGLMAAAMQGAHTANEDQLHRIAATLREARSRIYRILGEDEGPTDHDGDDEA
jgi:DNA-binding PadR family transcriptional regulator